MAMRNLLSSPHFHDWCLFACGVAVMAMMFMVVGNMEMPQ